MSRPAAVAESGLEGRNPSTLVGMEWNALTSAGHRRISAPPPDSKLNELRKQVNVSAFGKLAEICGQYLAKGSQVFIQGRLKTEKYTGKDGAEKTATKIVADRMQMLGGKQTEQVGKQGGDAPHPAMALYKPAPETRPLTTGNGFDDLENDIPF